MSQTLNIVFCFVLFGLVGSVNSFSQSCTYVSQANDMKPDKLCAPVEATWTVTYRGVDHGGTDVEILIDWDGGTTVETFSAIEISANEWQVVASNIYPEKGDRCNYEAQAWLVVNGVRCTSSLQTQLVTVWDVDDQNGGELNINPKIFPICIGNDGSVQFVDASLWNCTPPRENDIPNDRNRWTQWIYGTGATTITTAQVDGTVHAWPYTTPVEYYNAPVLAPAPPPSLSQIVYIPEGYEVGDYFEVTIRNWNTCNPYDDPNIPGPPVDPINGDHPPIETTAMALIVALPDATITPVGPFCDNAEPVILTVATPGGTWSGAGVDPSTGVFDPVAAGPGTHTITYEVADDNGCINNGTLDIEVHESPTVTIDAGEALSLCPGIKQILTAEISGGTTPYQSVTWSGDVGPLSDITVANPEFSTVVIGDYQLTVTVIDDTGCTGSASITVAVDALTVSFTPSTIEVCAGTPVQLNPIISGGTGDYTTHVWSGTAVDSLSFTDIPDPIFTSSKVGTVVFSYQVTDNLLCTAEAAEITIVVKEQPLADAGPDDIICGNSYRLQGDLPTGTIGVWQTISGTGDLTYDDTSLPDAQVTVDSYGSYELSWEVTVNGCSHTDLVSLHFSEIPVPSAGPDVIICGLTAALEGIPHLGTGSWSMSSGPGTPVFTDAANPLTEVTVDLPGSYVFQWSEQTEDLCEGIAYQTVEFMSQAKAVLAPFEDEGCAPLEITFTNLSTDAQSYRWEFGDSGFSNSENPTHRFENKTSVPMVNTVTMIARNSNQCNDTLTIDITTNPSPSARFTAQPMTGCSPLETEFDNISTGGDSFLWNFGDGTSPSTDREPSHTFVNLESFVQSFPVNLTTTNSYGCSDSAQLYISVFPVPTLNLRATPIEGCSPLETTLTADPGFQNYEWDFGDGSGISGNQFSITNLFENNGFDDATFEINVTGTTAQGCVATSSTVVTVYPSPNPDFTVTPETQQMPQRTVNIQNNTIGNWNYLWDFGDGNTTSEMNPSSHSFESSGTYPISLEVWSAHCRANAQKNIEITPMVPGIDYGRDAEGCPPLTVSFFNNTLDATTYLWEFGDGQISDDKEPSHTYRIPGVYTVKLTATGPGGSAVGSDVIVDVYDSPTALFEAVPKLIYIPQNEVTFLNRSIGAVTYDWDFGDGKSSSEFMPVHTYNAPGLFDVTLNVMNERGCTDEITVLGAVKAEQGGEMSFPNAFTPNPDGPSDGTYTYGDRSNHVFYPSVQKGIVEYQLQIFSRWGELMFQSNDVKKGWDGYFKNELCPQGVYIWRVRAKFSNGHITTQAGDVALIR